MAPCLCCADLSLMHWGCHGTMSWRGLRRWPTRIRKTIKFGTIGKRQPAVSYDPWGLWSNSTRPLLCLLLTRTSRAHLNSVPSLDLLSCRAFLSASTASFEPPPPPHRRRCTLEKGADPSGEVAFLTSFLTDEVFASTSSPDPRPSLHDKYGRCAWPPVSSIHPPPPLAYR